MNAISVITSSSSLARVLLSTIRSCIEIHLEPLTLSSLTLALSTLNNVMKSDADTATAILPPIVARFLTWVLANFLNTSTKPLYFLSLNRNVPSRSPTLTRAPILICPPSLLT